MRLGRLLLPLLLVVCTGMAQGQVRLVGLDRLYFDHLAGPSEPLPGLLRVLEHIPDNLRWPSVGLVEAEDGALVEDFPLETGSDHQIWIREVRFTTPSGIALLWWTLYDDGYRSDVWSYAANPRRHDGKVLSDYRIQETRRIGDVPGFLLVVRTELGRADDGWSLGGMEWSFLEEDGALSLGQIHQIFQLSFPGVDGAISATSERRVDELIETTQVDATAQMLQECGLPAPSSEPWDFSWTQMLGGAECLSQSPEAKQMTGAASAASLMERGGK